MLIGLLLSLNLIAVCLLALIHLSIKRQDVGIASLETDLKVVLLFLSLGSAGIFALEMGLRYLPHHW